MTDASQLTVEVERGQTVETPTGVTVTFVEAGHDDFEDGGFDDWVSLRFQRGDEVVSRMPSVLAESPVEPVLGVCWQLVDGGSRRVVLRLLPWIPEGR